MKRTFETRTAIGFPKSTTDWNLASAHFNAHSLRIAGHPVMEDWENEYMSLLARIVTRNRGRVLEVGYGLGISARAIQESSICDHVIIECHPDVILRCLVNMRSEMATGRVHLLTGLWQDIVPLLADESFDGILFDTYPLSAGEVHANHLPFFPHAYRLLKKRGILTYYSDEEREFSKMHLCHLREAGFDGALECEVCAVNPPRDCEYWQGTSIIAPIISKI
jgi:guanidinoacetate N-methyltransferase